MSDSDPAISCESPFSWDSDESSSPLQGGPIVKGSVEDTLVQRNYKLAVLGKLLDRRRFKEKDLQEWVSKWTKYNGIRVETVEDIIFFFCAHVEDRDYLLRKATLNFKGALIILSHWYPGASLTNTDFKCANMWVILEGIPFQQCNGVTARKLLDLIGRFRYYDEPSRSMRLLGRIRGRVEVNLSQPLIPGCYYEYAHEEFIWVYFRYEGVFEFCSFCGCVGHKKPKCKKSLFEAENDLQEVMRKICKGRTCFEDPCRNRMYTSKIRGFKKVERFRSSIINTTNEEELYAPHGVGSSSEERSEMEAEDNPPPPFFTTCKMLNPLKRKRSNDDPDDDTSQARKKARLALLPTLRERRGHTTLSNLQTTRPAQHPQQTESNTAVSQCVAAFAAMKPVNAASICSAVAVKLKL